jgi:hypothetical protein
VQESVQALKARQKMMYVSTVALGAWAALWLKVCSQVLDQALFL